MPTPPGSFADWDTNATHTSPVTSGHGTDGFAEDEVPDSDELNQWMMLVGLWIRYFAALAANTVNHHASAGKFGAANGSTPIAPTSLFINGGMDTSGSRARVNSSSSTDAEWWELSLSLPPGTTITGVRAILIDKVGGNGVASVSLYSGTGGVADTQVANQTSSGSGTKQTVSLGTLSTVVAANTYYYVAITSVNVSGLGACDIWMIEVDTTPP
jgi:hypothetical protein